MSRKSSMVIALIVGCCTLCSSRCILWADDAGIERLQALNSSYRRSIADGLLAELSRRFATAKTVAGRREVIIEAMDKDVFARGMSVSFSKKLFGDELIEEALEPSHGEHGLRSIVFLSPKQKPEKQPNSNPTLARPQQAVNDWRLVLEYEPDGYITNSYITNIKGELWK